MEIWPRVAKSWFYGGDILLTFDFHYKDGEITGSLRIVETRPKIELRIPRPKYNPKY
jgi:hypothetical protein